VDVTKYTSGRVFVSPGSPLIGLTAGTNYAPNFVSPTSANFLTRMDKYEITYGVPASGGAPTGGANLSSTDFFGIPLKLQTKGGSQPTTLTWNYNGAVNTAAAFQNLGALEGYETDTSANTLGALVANGANGVTINTPGGPMNGVVRIIAPSSTNGNTTPFRSFDNYVNSLQTGGTSPTSRVRTDNSQPADRSRTMI
jgi:Beta-1,3-glucanase